MKDPQRAWAWVGLAVLVIAVVVWLVWMPKPPQAAPSNPTPVYAAQGQLTPQFPQDLILDSNAVVTQSYSINYSSSTNQYTAEFDSSSTVTSLFNAYETFLAENSWTITGMDTTHPAFDVIAASQAGNQVQVVIDTDNGGSDVTVTYVVGQ